MLLGFSVVLHVQDSLVYTHNKTLCGATSLVRDNTLLFSTLVSFGTDD